MVYGMNSKPTQGYYVEYQALDGDMNAVRLIDETPDEGGKPTMLFGGRPIDPTHVPTRVRWKDRKKQPMADFDSGPLESVSARAMALIEKFEPGVHQFLPVEFVDIDCDFLEHRWFFICCNRLDTVDRDRTTFVLRKYPKASAWVSMSDLVRRGQNELIPPGYDTAQKSKLVFNRAQIGGAHMWVDKHLSSGVRVSDEFDAAYDAAGLTGRKAERKWQETV